MSEVNAINACGAGKSEGTNQAGSTDFRDYFAEGKKKFDEQLKKNSIFNLVPQAQTSATAIQG